MGQYIKVHNHPFRFLLYLEWILLAISIITSILPYPSPRFSSRFPEITIISLTIFGLMGLRLPTSNNLNKIVYTACEIILIFITGLFEGRAARMFPFLYIILVTRSCLIFKLPGRLSVTLISFSLFLFTLINRLPRPPLPLQAQERFRFFTLSLTLVFGLSLIFVLLLMNSLLSERQSREELAVANEKLRQYALRIENQATLEERNRIAREIHDSLGHSLTALNLQLETALKLAQSNPNKAQTFLVRAKELGSKALQDVRNSVSTMRSHPLQDKTLEQAIDIIAEDFQQNTGIILTSSFNLDYKLSTEVSTAIYRIIQESLTNISKHARATEVILEISLNRGSLSLIIRDNGRGFDIQQNTTGFGLQSMRDRTLALGGKFAINSDVGYGCQITVDIPASRLI
ncbi:Periplasmic Sensor Signal Transduction Histidine Kinase [Trichormus variabilis ATCC 29413]|uniref:histidine kinase n=2 Tax=Anabaena variabilis TaxID=264691 RepID=Q3MBI7_TRIV2|nr:MULTISPECIES: sensor histidine kinase [Nostocaceae]ABA21649.1 Periplasmic Sensor Signal Transduction Histidine Kinase [Trichormus variabilis ATCC 29413]MBC1215374.1 sensor histidine kinase [Trichormus variabilis ARAD]MBC1255058.1 sensor histidine kinase [Trichormus variabilis V5]MBC1268607.1 sensor histidine kinase [Trichormus variabilis FSR]MBC1302276.1 sensor histidine kinase [Trichormus variabilis N2B]